MAYTWSINQKGLSFITIEYVVSENSIPTKRKTIPATSCAWRVIAFARAVSYFGIRKRSILPISVKKQLIDMKPSK